MGLPRLPPRAAYLHLNNPSRRNALSLSVLRSLRDQLLAFNTSPSGRLLILPPFKPHIVDNLERGDEEYAWLLDGDIWRCERKGLPNVLVLRSEGPVFCSGHDLGELKTLDHDEVKETFNICADVMGLIRRSPAPVVGVVQGTDLHYLAILDHLLMQQNYRSRDCSRGSTGPHDRLLRRPRIHSIPSSWRLNRSPLHVSLHSRIPPHASRPSIPHARNGRASTSRPTERRCGRRLYS